MKEFNLEEAINGKAFYLHDNYRGVIKYSVDDLVSSSGNTPLYPYVGYILDDKGLIYKSLAAWDKNGKSNMAYSYNATTMVDDTPPQDNKKETMKKFDLKAALNGEPINANGQKCYVVREVTELLDDQSLRRFVVIFPDSFTNAEIWDEHDLIDDIGMWEEPKIRAEDLPKPFKPKDGDTYFYICGFKIFKINKFFGNSTFDIGNSQNGQCFHTEEDAQKWLDFMKGMLE